MGGHHRNRIGRRVEEYPEEVVHRIEQQNEGEERPHQDSKRTPKEREGNTSQGGQIVKRGAGDEGSKSE